MAINRGYDRPALVEVTGKIARVDKLLLRARG